MRNGRAPTPSVLLLVKQGKYTKPVILRENAHVALHRAYSAKRHVYYSTGSRHRRPGRPDYETARRRARTFWQKRAGRLAASALARGFRRTGAALPAAADL